MVWCALLINQGLVEWLIQFFLLEIIAKTLIPFDVRVYFQGGFFRKNGVQAWMN